MKNFSIKIILIFLISIIGINVSYANMIENIDTLPPLLLDSIYQKSVKCILIKDGETGKEIILKEGSRISYYRKDRNKLYNKRIRTITDDGFTVKSQNVKLTNIAKIKHNSIYKNMTSKILAATLLFLGIYLLIFSSIQLAGILGTFIVGLVLSQMIGFFIGGAIIVAIGVLMMIAALRKKATFFDFAKGATAQIFDKKSRK